MVSEAATKERRTVGKLSVAEQFVVESLAEGKRFAEIAADRGTAESTVKHQAYSAKKKLGARSLAHLVALFGRGRRG